MNELEDMNIELNPDNIVAYLMTTKGYIEEDDDRRKKPVFYWKGYHLYPVILSDKEGFDFDDDESGDVELTICTEGGNNESYNFIPMTAIKLKQFIRSNPEFRLLDAESVFSMLNVM